MTLTAAPPNTPPLQRTLRSLARLIGYPDAELRAHLDALRQALHAEAALPAHRLADIDALLDQLQTQDALDVEADYVQLFDSGKRTALHLFEHVHGDSRDRGPAMIDLAQTFEKGGLYLAEGEMPDYLPVILEFASTQARAEAVGFLTEIAHLIQGLFDALSQRGSRYASLMGALLDLAGVPASTGDLARKDLSADAFIDGPALDASWSEPEAFEGCQQTAGAGSRAGVGASTGADPQPIHIVRRSPTTPTASQRPGASAS